MKFYSFSDQKNVSKLFFILFFVLTIITLACGEQIIIATENNTATNPIRQLSNKLSLNSKNISKNMNITTSGQNQAVQFSCNGILDQEECESNPHCTWTFHCFKPW